MQSCSYQDNGVYKEAMEFFSGQTYKEVQDKMKSRLSELEQEYDIISMKRAKIGRNQQCPCGSGLKFKKCCLGKAR